MNPFNKSYFNYINPPDRSAFFHNLLYEDTEQGSIADECWVDSQMFCDFLQEYLDQHFSAYYTINPNPQSIWLMSLCQDLAYLLMHIERRELHGIMREAIRLSLMCNSKEGFSI